MSCYPTTLASPRITIGIDPGASCGVAVVTETHVAWTTVSLPSWRGYGSLPEAWVDHRWALYTAIRDLAKDQMGVPLSDVMMFAVEDSRHARGPQHAAMQGWHMALASSALSCQTPRTQTIAVAPSTWQWGIVGAQGRDAYVKYAQDLTGGVLAAKEHDAAAAICIAEWAWHQGVVE